MSLSVAARVVLEHLRAGAYIDPDESELPELQRTARSIASLVPLFRLRDSEPPMALADAVEMDATDLATYAIRRGDLRTALVRLGNRG